VDIATFPAALIAAIAIGLLNSSIKPILSQASPPTNYSTLGLFSIVVNGVLVGSSVGAWVHSWNTCCYTRPSRLIVC